MTATGAARPNGATGRTVARVPRSCYVVDYEGRFRFAVPPAAMWSAIEQVDQFPRWWGWLTDLRADVSAGADGTDARGGTDTAEGGVLHPGAVLQGTVSPPLPYRMRVRVDLERCVPARLIDASVHGDLEGHAHLRLEPDADATTAAVSWTIEMRQAPMRLAARVAYPLLRWGHDRVVDATVIGFRAHLRELERHQPHDSDTA